jgi:hypothetical protein
MSQTNADDPPFSSLQFDHKPLNGAQLQCLDTVRSQLEAESEYARKHFTSTDYLRFSVARRFDATATLVMMRTHIKWRIDNNVDNVLLDNVVPVRGFESCRDNNAMHNSFGKALSTCVGCSLHRFSKSGQPVLYLHAGYVDCAGFSACFSNDAVRDLGVAYLEYCVRVLMPEGRRRPGADPHNTVGMLVIDVTNLGLRQFHMPTLLSLKAFFNVVLENYP